MGRITGQCVCGAVTLSVPPPEYINECNCTMCTRLAAIWAYYPESEISITGETRGFVRTDMATPYLATHHCPTCACITHWVPLSEGPHARMGVNVRLLEEGAIEGVERRLCDGRSWPLD